MRGQVTCIAGDLSPAYDIVDRNQGDRAARLEDPLLAVPFLSHLWRQVVAADGRSVAERGWRYPSEREAHLAQLAGHPGGGGREAHAISESQLSPQSVAPNGIRLAPLGSWATTSGRRLLSALFGRRLIALRMAKGPRWLALAPMISRHEGSEVQLRGDLPITTTAWGEFQDHQSYLQAHRLHRATLRIAVDPEDHLEDGHEQV